MQRRTRVSSQLLKRDWSHAHCHSLVFNSLLKTIMSKRTLPKLSLPAMFKWPKRKRQPLRTPTPNPAQSHAPLAGRATTEVASLISDNLATSAAAPNSNPTPSHSETAPTPTSHSVAKDTVVNVLGLLLKTSSDIPRQGVKAALLGLLTIVERVQVR